MFSTLFLVTNRIGFDNRGGKALLFVLADIVDCVWLCVPVQRVCDCTYDTPPVASLLLIYSMPDECEHN